MASPELAIAKATLSATLFRADPTSTPRPVVEAFFPNLTAAVTQCSRPNVQKCRAWIVEHVANSKARSAALGKYLLALTKSFSAVEGTKPSLKRQRLHLLYVVNDVLYHTVVKAGVRTFEEAIAPVLPGLVAQAGSFKICPKHDIKLRNLVTIWTEKQYFASSQIPKLEAALSGNLEESDEVPEDAGSAGKIKLAKEVPYTLPSYHGDASTPWFDLPASTWLPHLTPNSTTPMQTDMIQPIRLAGGPANESLVTAVQGLLADVDRLYSKRAEAASEEEDQRFEVNELGERILLDEITGDIVGGETYYGWSRQFCEKMRDRKRAAKAVNLRGRSRSRSRSRSDRSGSRSRSRSHSARGFKRRRSSSSASERGFRQRSFSRGRGEGHNRQRRDYSASRSRSRSRSRSPPRGFKQRRSPAPSKSYQQPPQQPPNHFVPPPPPPQQGFPQPPFPPGQFPPPPPRPAGYQGPWPPPPPPPVPFNGPPPSNWFSTPNAGGRNTNNPPAPQQRQSQYGQHQQNQYNNYNRGGDGYNGRGRGGYHRGGRGGY